MPTEFQAMTAKGSPLGSGGILVFDENTCIVDAMKIVAEFNEEESCGKCFPCRKGTSQIVHIFENIVAGYGETGDLEKIAGIGQTMVAGSLCGLGQLAPGVLNNAVRYFPEEFAEHVTDKYCRTGTCAALRGPVAPLAETAASTS
jgi:NADH:ubiquinone oxidoreductase subunit F (NADH-binding)